MQGAIPAKDLLYPRLVTLMQLIDESAAIIYPRKLHRPHLTRFLIFLIGLSGSLASRELVLATGYEKAQISRGIKGLAEAGLLDRPELRGAIRLNSAGQALFEDIMVIARERDRTLRDGISDSDIARFLELTGLLIDRAALFVIAEEGAPPTDRPRPSIAAPTANDLLLPSLRGLMVYIRRSGTITFRREVGLSNLEWRVLALIADNAPVNLSALIRLVARDKSQVGRTVKQLTAAGLVERRDEGRVNVELVLTPEGQACTRRIRAIGAQRDGLLFAALRPGERDFYMDVLGRIVVNAGGLLCRERAARGEHVAGLEPRPARDAGDAHELDALRDENMRLKQRLAAALREIAGLRDIAT
jgi:DNA-binding MarR family transcriptional regulator